MQLTKHVASCPLPVVQTLHADLLVLVGCGRRGGRSVGAPGLTGALAGAIVAGRRGVPRAGHLQHPSRRQGAAVVIALVSSLEGLTAARLVLVVGVVLLVLHT